VVGPNASGIDFVASQTSFAAPAITTQPASQTVNPGTSAAFSVAATGTAPLRYQWRFQRRQHRRSHCQQLHQSQRASQ
jgi:hypothetical protein